MFIWEVVDKAMSIDGDVNTVDTSVGAGKIIQLDGCDGHRGKGFLLGDVGCMGETGHVEGLMMGRVLVMEDREEIEVVDIVEVIKEIDEVRMKSG